MIPLCCPKTKGTTSSGLKSASKGALFAGSKRPLRVPEGSFAVWFWKRAKQTGRCLTAARRERSKRMGARGIPPGRGPGVAQWQPGKTNLFASKKRHSAVELAKCKGQNARSNAGEIGAKDRNVFCLSRSWGATLVRPPPGAAWQVLRQAAPQRRRPGPACLHRCRPRPAWRRAADVGCSGWPRCEWGA